MTHQRVENLLGHTVIDIHFHIWGLGEEISTIFAAISGHLFLACVNKTKQKVD